MSEDVLSLSQLKAEATRLLDRARDQSVTLVLTQNGRARAVVQDDAQYQARERAMLMLKQMAEGEREVGPGNTASQADVFAALRAACRRGAIRTMASSEVRWTRTAQRDLDAIVSWIAEHSIGNALDPLVRPPY